MADMEAAMAKRQVTPEMMTHSQEKIRKLQREREFINNQKGAHFYGGDISDLQKRSVEMERGSANLPKEGFAKSSTGKAWENTADSSIESQTVGDTLEWYRQKLKDREGYQKAQGMFAEDQYMQNIINAARQRDSTDKVSQEALANTNVDLQDWLLGEVLSGVADVQAATYEAFVPQMLNYESVDGVNFKKGCYPGQEVVARSQFRGILKRRTYVMSSPVALQAGVEIFSNTDSSQPAGLVAQAVSHAQHGHWALVCLQTAAEQADTLYPAGSPDSPLRLHPLPYTLREDI
ncbi:MAG: hypothetical protein EBW49_09605 [Betaproteobacteria bacterium]|nr:hypothetical protein [Betaproteobacteria bacterium]